MLLKQIFVQNGQPIRMHIDSSIANVNVRATISTRIMASLVHFNTPYVVKPMTWHELREDGRRLFLRFLTYHTDRIFCSTLVVIRQLPRSLRK